MHLAKLFWLACICFWLLLLLLMSVVLLYIFILKTNKRMKSLMHVRVWRESERAQQNILEL